MKYRYDLHIHSALSPCAEEEMTPVTVVGQAALSGLDFVAIADHNAIGHVPLALRAGVVCMAVAGARAASAVGCNRVRASALSLLKIYGVNTAADFVIFVIIGSFVKVIVVGF